MRKFFAVIAALMLALLITGAVFYFQGKSLGDLFKEDEPLPQLPTISEDALPQLPSNPQAPLSYENRLSNGDQYFEQGFYSLAANEYVEASKLKPQELAPYQKLVETHLALKNYSKALSNAEAILEKNPNDLDARFKVILIQVKLSDFEKAKQLLDNYPNDKKTAEILYYKGILAALFDENDGAKANLNEALSLTNNSELKEKIENVLNAYKEFGVNQEAENLFLRQLIAKSFNENEEYEMAIYILKDVLKTRSELRDGWVLLGFAYLNLEQYEFAKTAFEKAYSLDTTWPTTQYFLGVTYKELGFSEEAITYLNAALGSNFTPKVIIQNHLADLYFETEDYSKAVAAYEAVLKVNQQNVDNFIRPIWIHIDYLNQPKEALELAQQAVALFPDSAMAYNLLGWSYLGTQNYTQAEANLEKALNLDPNLAAAHQNLGSLREVTGDYDQALSSYERAYELDKGGSIGNLAAQKYNALIQKTLTPNNDEN